MNQCYFNGDFYQCDTATTAGQSPATHDSLWRKIKLPSKWRWVLAQLTYAHLLRLDGQTDKANVERSIAYGRDRTGLDDIIRQEANEENHAQCNRGRNAGVNTGRTRPVAASVILDDAYRLIGWDAEDLDDREKQDARMALSTAVQEVWEAWWWQELMVCAQTQFAPTWANEPLAGTYYWPPTDKYYIHLITDAVIEPVDSEGNTNFSAWADYADTFTLVAWVSTTTYEQGDQVSHYGVNYQCTTAGGVSGTAPDQSFDWAPLSDPSLDAVLRQPYPIPGGTTVTGVYGPIRSVSKFDPRTSANPQPFELDVTQDGTRVLKLSVGRPWVWSRRVTPIITGDEFSTTATYEATDPQDLVYDS